MGEAEHGVIAQWTSFEYTVYLTVFDIASKSAADGRAVSVTIDPESSTVRT